MGSGPDKQQLECFRCRRTRGGSINLDDHDLTPFPSSLAAQVPFRIPTAFGPRRACTEPMLKWIAWDGSAGAATKNRAPQMGLAPGLLSP